MVQPITGFEIQKIQDNVFVDETITYLNQKISELFNTNPNYPNASDVDADMIIEFIRCEHPSFKYLPWQERREKALSFLKDKIIPIYVSANWEVTVKCEQHSQCDYYLFNWTHKLMVSGPHKIGE
jgi:hypothetical protein